VRLHDSRVTDARETGVENAGKNILSLACPGSRRLAKSLHPRPCPKFLKTSLPHGDADLSSEVRTSQD